MHQSRLAILDIDGTLTDTIEVDDECFRRAMALALGVPASVIDWADAPHITDTGICYWLFERHREQQPSSLEVAAAKAEFLRLLESEAGTRPHRFTPVAGGRDVLSHLAQDGWSIALATGAWGASARIKLASCFAWRSIGLARRPRGDSSTWSVSGMGCGTCMQRPPRTSLSLESVMAHERHCFAIMAQAWC